MRDGTRDHRADGRFQSAPGREAGRCLTTMTPDRSPIVFQSAPGREAGRCLNPPPMRNHHGSFNPRPAVRPGDALFIG